MKIYINNVLQKTEILPSNTPTLDETLETFSFALISNTNPIPLAPMQKVDVDFLGDGSEIAHFYIVSDSVETYSLNPLRYKHNISCIQNTRELSKHLVRNSVFTQPSYLEKGSYNATNRRGNNSNISYDGHQTWNEMGIPSLNWASEPLTLDSKEKIKKAYIKVSFQFVTNNTTGVGFLNPLYTNAQSISDILENTSNRYSSLTFNGSPVLAYKDANNQDQTQVLDYSFNDLINKKIELPEVKELADEGANNFKLQFQVDDYTAPLLNAIFDNTVVDDNGLIVFYMLQMEIIAETYYYTTYDLLELLIKRQQKIDSKNQNALPLFLLPEENDNPELYNLLKNTIAPNFTFTQLTMYECVAEVFRLFDAIFTMDEDGILGIEYFNDLSKENIIPRITGRNLSLGEDKYTNGLVSYYQDARKEVVFPNNRKFAPIRSEELGVPEAQDHSFIVPHNIQSIIKCELQLGMIYLTYNGSEIQATGDFTLDISRWVVSDDVWSVLDTGDFSDTDKTDRLVKQANSVIYTPGDNKIKLAYFYKNSWGGQSKAVLKNLIDSALVRMAGCNGSTNLHANDSIYSSSGTNWRDVYMRLRYFATLNGEAKIHSLTNKYEGETLIDQANGAVDLNKLGLNMLGLALKLGNPTLNATHRITTWEKRIKQGQLYEYQGRLWVANVVNYTFFKGMIQGKVSFVQNFNALSLRTQLLREKRMTNISQQLTQKSEEVITDYIYFSSKEPFYLGFQDEEIRFKTEYLSDFLRDSFDIVGPFSCVGDVITYNPEAILNHFIFGATYIPLVKYGSGNTINFEVSYEHPMNAGNKTDVTTNWATTSYFTSHALYTDNVGFLDTICVKAPTKESDYDHDFPYVKAVDETSQEGDYYFLIKDLQICKQPNEIFALNYQLAFLPLPNRELTDFIGSAFINNNCFVNDMSKVIDRTLYIYFKEEKSSVLDTKFGDYIARRKITNVQTYRVGHTTELEFTFQTLGNSLKNKTISWAVCDENENVMFASNEKSELTNTNVSIWFMSRLSRLD